MKHELLHNHDQQRDRREDKKTMRVRGKARTQQVLQAW